MNKFFKTGMLIILIGVPVFIIFFLNLFGSNTYTVPPLRPFEDYEEMGIANPSTMDCAPRPTGQPIRIPSGLSGHFSEARFKLVALVDQPCDEACVALFQELLRVDDKFRKDQRVKFLFFDVSPADLLSSGNWETERQSYFLPENWNFIEASESPENLAFLTCELFLGDADRLPPFRQHLVALVSPTNRLTGIYDLSEKEGVDRLAVEVQILKDEF